MEIVEAGSIKKGSILNKSGKKFLWVLFWVIIVLTIMIARVQLKYIQKIVAVAEVSSPNVALVFGAGLKAEGRPSDILEDRIRTAIRLYQEGKVGKIIMSGDNIDAEHDETAAMKNFAVEQGVAEEDIFLDDEGVTTLASCLNLKKKFDLPKAVLVTQRYHLGRALYLCNELGIEAVGVKAINRGYVKQARFTAREMLASVKAWWEVKVSD